ncbi:unnamed protein product [Kuraishia capsulata CBS 1993]|uniref:Uncharacterized protein n=1 Tax=Kuraishia capsulata CBS 1993 TaxID=1382522 RepID=W6MRU7_9ASCO|nr:uncharacterized protein KUCA_T00005080001 [Kuraishia capsulata CBS 1993]CDK29093.1 unnamed protein product [Kuraishia capsulata CBS 1993]
MPQFYDLPLSFDSLSESSKELLCRVPDYPLDYNLFIFKGIHKVRPQMKADLCEFRVQAAENTPRGDNADKAVHLGILKPADKDADANDYELELTTTSKLQDRLMKILILERHRRDIAMLNRVLEQENKSITPIALTDPLVYKIKSPLFATLWSQHYDNHEQSFKKFAILQNLEYEFERDLSENPEVNDVTDDDSLIRLFCDSKDVMEFDIKDQIDQDLLDKQVLDDSKIVQIMIPLAAQAILMGVSF